MDPEELWVVNFKLVLGPTGSPEVTEASVWDNDFKQILSGKHSEIQNFEKLKHLNILNLESSDSVSISNITQSVWPQRRLWIWEGFSFQIWQMGGVMSFVSQELQSKQIKWANSQEMKNAKATGKVYCELES